MRRAALVVALLASMLSLTGASPAAGPIDWKHLPYLLYDSGQMLLTTNATWEHAKVVPPVQPGQRPPDWVGDFYEKQGVKLGYIWAPTCLSGSQNVTMTKPFFSLGRPHDGSLFFTPGHGYPLPLAGADVLVNNRSIGHLGNTNSVKARKYIQKDLTPGDLAAFHYGPNKLTIRVSKLALPKGEACNNRNRLLGGLMTLGLNFQHDLAAQKSAKGEEEVIHLAAGGTGAGIGVLRFTNNGPSASAGGTVIIRISANTFVKTAATPMSVSGSAPFRECVGEGSGVAAQITLTCPFDGFPAGASSSLNVLTGAIMTPEFPSNATSSLTVDWQIKGTGADANGGNNYAIHTFFICGPTATDSRCK